MTESKKILPISDLEYYNTAMTQGRARFLSLSIEFRPAM